MTQGVIAKIVLDPAVFSTLDKAHHYFLRMEYLVAYCHVICQFSVCLYKKFIDYESIGNGTEASLVKTSVNSLANLANTRTCSLATLFLLTAAVLKDNLTSERDTSFFYAISLGACFLIFYFQLLSNIAFR